MNRSGPTQTRASKEWKNETPRLSIEMRETQPGRWAPLHPPFAPAHPMSFKSHTFQESPIALPPSRRDYSSLQSPPFRRVLTPAPLPPPPTSNKIATFSCQTICVTPHTRSNQADRVSAQVWYALPSPPPSTAVMPRSVLDLPSKRC